MPYDPTTGTYKSRFDGLFGAPPATATLPAQPRMSGEQAYKLLEDRMTGQATSIEQQEQNRYQQGLAGLSGAYDEAHKSLSSILDPDLLFSQASDSIGAKSGEQMDALRRSLGARGLNPNSGAASGLLSRIVFGKQQALAGAKLGGEIESLKLRQAAAAQNFANMLNLAGYTNSPVPQIGLDVSQNLYEGLLAREGLHNQRQSNKEANQNNLFGSIIGGIGSLAGALL